MERDEVVEYVKRDDSDGEYDEVSIYQDGMGWGDVVWALVGSVFQNTEWFWTGIEEAGTYFGINAREWSSV